MNKNICSNFRIQKKYNDIKKFIQENPIEKYIMMGVFVMTLIIIILKVFYIMFCNDNYPTYIQYYL